MLRTIIIEDEKPAARRLERMLNRNGLKVVATLHSVAESIRWFRKNKESELIFLDIQLADGLSFEIFEHIKIESAIIFTTAYEKYAIKAFKLNSIDYLLKPIDEDELRVAVAKYKKLQTISTNTSLDLLRIKKILQEETATYKERFTIHIGQHLKLIETKNIECLYSQDKATYACLKSGKVYLLDGSLENLFNRLNPQLFFKVNRKFIVNIHAIKDIISYSNSRLQVILESFRQDEIIVSREKVKDFKLWLE